MLLLALAPTVSRVVGVHAPGHHHEAGQGGHAAHHASGIDEAGGGDGGDCWSRCGYCDFLAHAPALGAITQAIALLAMHPSIPAGLLPRQPRLTGDIPAAQPRGPPALG